jgi:hypothetical protein
MLTDQSEKSRYIKKTHFLSQKDNGDGRFPLLQAEGCVLMPAWDARYVAYVHRYHSQHMELALIPLDRFLEALVTCRGAGDTSQDDLLVGILPPQVDMETVATWTTGDLGYCCRVSGCVLTENAALILVQFLEDREGPEGTKRDKFWHVAAYAREDGEKMWEVDLPSVPLHDGLAVAADGSVVVALRDGSILCVRGKR